MDISVSGATLPTFEGFNNNQTYYSGQGGEVRVALVDLNGYAGDELTLDFRNNRYQRLANGEHLGEWTGLTEIEVFRKAPLQLMVDPNRGDVFLQNCSADPVSLNGYQIISESGLLQPDSWDSLDDQDYNGGGTWQEAGSVSSTNLTEMYLTGNSELVAGQSISLGKLFDTTSAVDGYDLSFHYSASGTTWIGDVDYQNAMTSYSWAVLKDNPKLYYNFNDAGSSQFVGDSVRGQMNDQLTATNATRAAGYTANLGQTAVFDGSGFFAGSSMDDGQTAGAWAIEFWMKDDTATPGEANSYITNIIGSSETGVDTNSPAVIYGFNDGKFEVYADSAGRAGSDGPTITDNDWHHIVVAFYGDGTLGVADRLEIAVDGVVSSINRGSFSKQIDNREQLLIGGSTA